MDTPRLSQSTASQEARTLSSAGALESTIERARGHLLAQQQEDGHWCAELEGDSILQSEYILLLAWMGRERSPDALAAARTLVETQLIAGGWNMYPGGKLEISGSVKAYFALKLTGHDPEAEYMVRAREAIRAAGGADRVNSFTRFYLALLGQIPYAACPAVPPELALLPSWSPINLDRMSAWSRTIVVPLSIMWAHRPVRNVPDECGIAELFIRPVEQWPELRCPGLEEETGWFRWDAFFRGADRWLKTAERWGVRPLRSLALRKAERWMLARFRDSDGLGAIFPPIIWSIVALRCLGYAEDSPEVEYNFAQLEKLKIRRGDTLRLQPCLSPVWDTANTLRAITACGDTIARPAVRNALEWLLEKEVRTPGDWSHRTKVEPGGWFFEYRNAFYPDVDDTIMVLMALRGALGSDAPATAADGVFSLTGAESKQAALDRFATVDRTLAAVRRGRRWVEAMQNRDGGWGAFDRDNDDAFLCRVPFADHNAMIDPSTPDLTGRTLEAFAAWGAGRGEPGVERAIEYLRRTQEADGAWYGRWGVNYVYGTWQALVGLNAIGLPSDDPMMVRGAEWLLEHQQADGSWGESADSYEDSSLRGKGNSTPSQTAWGLLGLLAAGYGEHEAVLHAVNYLVTTQCPDGTWEETEFTGTGFPRVFYLRYHAYRNYFPLLALANYRDRKGT